MSQSIKESIPLKKYIPIVNYHLLISNERCKCRCYWLKSSELRSLFFSTLYYSQGKVLKVISDKIMLMFPLPEIGTWVVLVNRTIVGKV